MGCIEPQFYARLLELTEIVDPDFQNQWDRGRWPRLKERLAARFLARSRDEWCALMEGTDACVAPVLDMVEAPVHPHNAFRGAFTNVDGVTQPAPAPRFSRSAPELPPRAPVGGAALDAMREWGIPAAVVASLLTIGVL